MNKSTVTPYCRKIETLSIAGLLFILPFEGTNTIQEILFFSLISAFLVKNILEYKNISSTLSLPSKTLTALIIISFLWGIIALIHAIDPAYSLREIMTKMSRQYLLYFLSFFIVCEISFERIKLLLFPMVLSTLIMSVYACYQFYLLPIFFENRVSGLTGAFYRLCTFLILSIPIISVLAFTFRGWLKRLCLITVLVSFAAVFFTFTRAAWIALIVESSILIFILLKNYKKYLLSFIIAMSLTITVLSYKSIIPNQLIIHGSEKPRIEALKLSGEIIRKNPVTGIGYGKRSFSKYYPDIEVVKHTHNIFLNTAIELGIPGLLILTAMLAVIANDFLRVTKKEILLNRNLVLAGIFVSFVGFLSLNLFDYMYHGWPGQMFWMLMGIGYALIKHAPDADSAGIHPEL